MTETAKAPDYKRGFGWNFVFNVFTKIATPLIGIVVANRLGPTIMGTYWLITTVLIFADIFRDSVFMRVYLREPEITEALDHGYARYSVVGHAIMALVIAGIAKPMATHFGQDVLLGGLLLSSLAVLLNGFSALPYTRLVKAARFKEAGFAEAMGSVLSSLAALGLVRLGWGFWALAWMPPIRSIVVLALTYRHSPYRLSQGERGLTRRVLGASSILTGINLMWVGFSFGDQLLVSQIFGLALGGSYGAGKMMVQSADVLAKPITQTATVALAERKGDPELVGKTLYKSLSVFIVAIAPVYVAVALFAKPLVLSILSSHYAPTVTVLPALCVYYAAIYPGSFAGDAMVLAGREKVPFYGWIATYVYLGLMFAFAWKQMSLVAFAWLLASGLVLVNASTLTYAVRTYPPTPEGRSNILRGLGALAVTFGCVFGISVLPLADVPRLLVALFLVPIAHLAAIGTLFNQNPLSMLGRTGVKELWRRL